MKLTTFIKKYQGRILQDDGAYKSKEFIQFARDLKNTVKTLAKEVGAEVTYYHIGHYDVFGFVRKADNVVYFSYSEPRRRSIDLHCKDAMNGILVRTATDEKDFHGGMNHFCNFVEMKSVFEELLGESSRTHIKEDS